MDGQTESPGQETRRGAGLEPPGTGWKEEAAKQGWRRCFEEEERVVGSVGGRERAEAAGARPLRRLIPPRPAESRERGAGGMEVGNAMHVLGLRSRELRQAGSRERGLAAQPPTRRVPRPRPLGTGQPAAGTGCRCSRRGPAAQRDAGEGSAKRWSETKRSGVKIAGGRERCQFIRTPSTRGGSARRLHTSSPLRRG